jgi:hypothetical protein
MFVYCHLTPVVQKFSASSFYPGCNTPSLPSATYVDNRACLHFDIPKEAGQVGGHNNNDSDIETEAEWFDETLDDAPKNPSQMSEVCSILLFWQLYT